MAIAEQHPIRVNKTATRDIIRNGFILWIDTFGHTEDIGSVAKTANQRKTVFTTLPYTPQD